jgi:hypothetical protein
MISARWERQVRVTLKKGKEKSLLTRDFVEQVFNQDFRDTLQGYATLHKQRELTWVLGGMNDSSMRIVQRITLPCRYGDFAVQVQGKCGACHSIDERTRDRQGWYSKIEALQLYSMHPFVTMHNVYVPGRVAGQSLEPSKIGAEKFTPPLASTDLGEFILGWITSELIIAFCAHSSLDSLHPMLRAI